VRQGGYILGLYRDARSTEHKPLMYNKETTFLLQTPHQ